MEKALVTVCLLTLVPVVIASTEEWPDQRNAARDPDCGVHPRAL